MIPLSTRVRGLGTRWIGPACVCLLAAAAEGVGSAGEAVSPGQPVRIALSQAQMLPKVQVQPDPLRGTPAVKPDATGIDVSNRIGSLLPNRSDSPYDWHAPVEPLHQPCEPRALPPCVPPPPCHPSEPPEPYDLVGVAGCPTAGPIYRGPCEPRTGTPHQGPFAWCHRLYDRLFDHFYMWK